MGKGLVRACTTGDADSARAALKAGDDVDKHNGRALLAAVSRGHVNAARVLLEAGARVDRRMDVAHPASSEVPGALWTEPMGGATLLHLCASAPHLAGMTALLLEHRADPGACTSGVRKNTALHLAAACNCADVAWALLAGGAPRDVRNADGLTPLHVAVRNKHSRTVEVLLQGGANVNFATALGNTALHIVCGIEFGEVLDRMLARLLLEYGADARLRNNEGKTPLECITRVGLQRGVFKALVANTPYRGVLTAPPAVLESASSAARAQAEAEAARALEAAATVRAQAEAEAARATAATAAAVQMQAQAEVARANAEAEIARCRLQEEQARWSAAAHAPANGNGRNSTAVDTGGVDTKQADSRTLPAAAASADAPASSHESADVMISYRVPETGDGEGGDGAVFALEKALRARGYSVFVGEDAIEGGDDWPDTIQRGVRECKAFVVLCSPTYGDTLWTKREIVMADNLKKPLLAVWHSGPYPPPGVQIYFSGKQRIPLGNIMDGYVKHKISHESVAQELAAALVKCGVFPDPTRAR